MRQWIFVIPFLACITAVTGQQTQPEQLPGTIQLSSNQEIPLSGLVDYASRRLGFQIIYDASIAGKQVRLIAPDPIPESRFYDVLQSILISEGLVISDPDESGIRRITANANLARLASPSGALGQLQGIGAAVPVTRLIKITHIEPVKAIEILKPFLSDAGASIIGIENRDFIIVTDTAGSVRRISEMVELLDSGGPLVDVRFVVIKNIRAEPLAAQLNELLAARSRAMGRSNKDSPQVEITVDSRTNQLVLIGSSLEIERAIELIETIDVALPTVQRTFSLTYIAPERLDSTIREILEDRSVSDPYRSRTEGNALIVESSQEILDLTDRLRRTLDTREAPITQSRIRFYKVKNVPANELAETLRSIGGGGQVREPMSLPPRRLTTNDRAIPGPNISPFTAPGAAQPIQIPPVPPAMGIDRLESDRTTIGPNESLVDPRIVRDEMSLDRNISVQPLDSIDAAILNANVTVDLHTNSIIVFAAPEVQRIFASLIETLDQRRPQVLVEARVVIIDTSDDYTFGVEVSGGDRMGAKRLFAFSSYGLSEVDPITGALQILPGIGFNGTLVDPSTADVVVRAIAQHDRARILSTPRVLVNDNAEGQLTSVLEVPFTSINASQTVATTSFAGFAEAGTTITVRPTIADDNYLSLEYVVTLNSFSGPGAAGVPPPRQTNEVRSRVTVPDGYTVIVGGLVSKNDSYGIDSIPILEKIPVLRELSSLQTSSSNQTSLFVFLRPVILREDKFKDLKFLSGVDLQRAGEPGNYPATPPMMME